MCLVVRFIHHGLRGFYKKLEPTALVVGKKSLFRADFFNSTLMTRIRRINTDEAHKNPQTNYL
jgi:hypothetical protein